MVSDEFECLSYLNSNYGTWFVNVNNNLVNDILNQAMDKCSQVENSFLYCILCMGSQCRMQPSETMINYIRSCLNKLSIDTKMRDSIMNILNKALEKSSDILCVGE